jgi:dCMP deaminase
VTVNYVSDDGTVAGELPLDEWELSMMPSARPSWDDYFIQLCHLVATRATCDRKHVGAVLVRDRRILATGYNGSAPGEPHCDDAGHDLVLLLDGTKNCVRTIHAEANALLQAAKYGIATEGTTLYTNTYPCWPCTKLILGAGIVEIVVDADYNNDPRVEGAVAAKHVAIRRYKIT